MTDANLFSLDVLYVIASHREGLEKLFAGQLFFYCKFLLFMNARCNKKISSANSNNLPVLTL